MVALAAVVVLTVAAAADGSSRTLSVTTGATEVIAFDGRVVWSMYVRELDRYVLMERVAGVTRRIPVRSRGVPFDVDLGRTSTGSAAVYSRCARDPFADEGTVPDFTGGRACRLFRYDFTAKRESRIRVAQRAGDSFVRPTLWRDSLAYIQSNSTDGVSRAQIFLRRNGRTTRVEGGTAPGLLSGPVSMDLRGSRLLFTWRGIVDRCPGQTSSPTRGGPSSGLVELWLVNMQDGARSLRERNLSSRLRRRVGLFSGWPPRVRSPRGRRAC
jgi:hypothetical protein